MVQTHTYLALSSLVSSFASSCLLFPPGLVGGRRPMRRDSFSGKKRQRGKEKNKHSSRICGTCGSSPGGKLGAYDVHPHFSLLTLSLSNTAAPRFDGWLGCLRPRRAAVWLVWITWYWHGPVWPLLLSVRVPSFQQQPPGRGEGEEMGGGPCLPGSRIRGLDGGGCTRLNRLCWFDVQVEGQEVFSYCLCEVIS